MNMLGSKMTIGSLAVLAMSTAVLAQDVPYEYSTRQTSVAYNRGARLIYPARLHREVEVSRSLAAQPVHPHMAKIAVGGGGEFTPTVYSSTLTTYIDPLRRLDGENGLDEGHSFVRAQRLHLQLSGVSTRQLYDLQNHSLAQQQRLGPPNKARLIISPQRYRADAQAGDARPVFIFRKPAPAPKRDRADDKLVARAGG